LDVPVLHSSAGEKTGLAKGSRVLDVGCGQGFFTGLFADLNNGSWRHHSFEAVKNHLSRWPQARIYFSLRLDAIVLNTLALSSTIA
jgi:protein-L-isoaspartate O-methyltransferase